MTARGNNSIGLACNYLSFVVSGYLWKCLTKIKADYVFTFEVSPMTQALIGVWYANKDTLEMKNIALAGRKTIMEKFTWKNSAEALRRVYYDIVQKNK